MDVLATPVSVVVIDRAEVGADVVKDVSVVSFGLDRGRLVRNRHRVPWEGCRSCSVRYPLLIKVRSDQIMAKQSKAKQTRV